MYQKVSYRPIDQLLEIIDEGHRITQRTKFALYSPSFTHPQRNTLLQALIDRKFTFSLPSFRIEYLDTEALALIKKGGNKTLTVAPECGETLRKKINKHTSDEKFFTFFKHAAAAGFSKIKLYMMVGLPGQDEKDLQEMVQFVKEARNHFTKSISLSINSYVPKPQSPFAAHLFSKRIIKRQLTFLQKALYGQFKIKTADLSNSYLEWKLAHAKNFEEFENTTTTQEAMEMV